MCVLKQCIQLIQYNIYRGWYTEGGGAEKLELITSKTLDSTSLQNKKLVLIPLCYVKNNVAPPPPSPSLPQRDAKRRISLSGNNLLPDFSESFKVRDGYNVQLMKKMFIPERDRQYNITEDIEQLQNRFQYLLSDNPTCAARFLSDDYKPSPHDDSNITRCKK